MIKEEYEKALKEFAENSEYTKEQIMKAALLPIMEAFELKSVVVDGIEFGDIEDLREDVEEEIYRF